MEFKRAIQSLVNREAARFTDSFLPLDPTMARKNHPYDALYKKTPTAIQSFLNSFEITASLKPEVVGRIDSGNGERLTIKLFPWKEDMLKEMQQRYPDAPFLRTAVYQKFYMDPSGNSPRSVAYLGPFGHPFLEFNNVGAIGADVKPGSHVNLFLGASDIFNASKNPIHYGDIQPIDDWVLETEIPFSEMATNLNGGMEGANFPLIIEKGRKYVQAINAAGGIVENLVVFGGWHNLIYNENTAEAWSRYADQLRELAPRVCFYEIVSPILKFDFKTIENYKDQGMGRWGNIIFTEEKHEMLTTKMREYNTWLANYCEQHEDAMMIPLQSLVSYEEAELTTLFMDINHFRRSEAVSKLIIDNVNDFLSEKAEFFAPKLSEVSEYVYPTF